MGSMFIALETLLRISSECGRLAEVLGLEEVQLSVPFTLALVPLVCLTEVWNPECHLQLLNSKGSRK